MKLFGGHLDLTAKSVTVAAGSILGVVVAFGYLDATKAAALSACIAGVASLVVPDRNAGAQ